MSLLPRRNRKTITGYLSEPGFREGVELLEPMRVLKWRAKLEYTQSTRTMQLIRLFDKLAPKRFRYFSDNGFIYIVRLV